MIFVVFPDQEDSSGGMQRSQLINWYLEEMEAEIESEEDLVQKKALVERVIDRLVLQVATLIWTLLFIIYTSLSVLFII